MRLRTYAQHLGVSYKTAYRWWPAGKLDAYQLDTGTIIVRDPVPPIAGGGGVALYARVSSADQKSDLERQTQRWRDYAARKGDTVPRDVSEIASGLNDHRPKLTQLLADPASGTIVVEHKDRLTRLGFASIRGLLEVQGRPVEVVFPSETDNELVDDFVAVMTSLAARIYGQGNSRRRAARMKACVEQVMGDEDGGD
jgi:putative resolvase